MADEQTKTKSRLLWIAITAIVGTVVSVMVTWLFQSVSQKEPEVVASVDLNTLAGREPDGQLFSLVGLHYDGDKPIERIKIWVKLEQGGPTDFRLVEFEPRAGNAKCVTDYETAAGKLLTSATCEYLNPGDTYSFSLWHEGMLWHASVNASAPGITYSWSTQDYDGNARTCAALKPIAQNMKIIPKPCTESYWR